MDDRAGFCVTDKLIVYIVDKLPSDISVGWLLVMMLSGEKSGVIDDRLQTVYHLAVRV